jgi:cell division protein FtsQ
MKKILYILLATLLFAYLCASIYYLTNREEAPAICENVEVVVADSMEKQFLGGKDIVAYLTKANLYPLHKNRDEINTYLINEALLKNEIVESSEVVRSVSGKITITITQKMPILRIFSSAGNYFVDQKGQTMPALLGQPILVPIASGNIEKSFAVSELYKFALFLQDDAFWNDQITQIFVRSTNDVEIVPRVGNHRILMGSLDDFELKLKRLRLFYDQVIPKMGWDKYSVINLKFKNQIVCTKK